MLIELFLSAQPADDKDAPWRLHQHSPPLPACAPPAPQVTPQAEVQQLELAKLRVTHTLGVQLRDLR